MAIEFRCPNCDKKLKTGDDKAGRTAKCPQCGTSVTVPAASTAADVGDEFEAFGAFDDPTSPQPPRRAGGTAAQTACPMCGAMNAATASRCYACGEDLYAAAAPAPGERPANFDPGDQLSKGYDLFKADMGNCIVVALLYLFIPGGINQALGLILNLAVGGAGNQGGGNDAALGIMIVGQVLIMVVQFLVQVYFDAGATLYFLNVIRRRPAQVGDLFAGGPFFLTLALNRIVLGLLCVLPYLPGGAVIGIGAAVGGDAGPIIIGVGGLLLLIGIGVGVYLAAMFWPHCWLIVDRNLPGLTALKASPHLTSGYRGGIILMGLLYGLLTFAGMLACCLGVIFTTPIACLMTGIGYDRLVRARGVAAS